MSNFETDINNLINLRTNLITIIIVLTGGLVGLMLSDIDFYRSIIFIVAGIYFDALFIRNVIDVHNNINDIIRRNRQ